MKIYGFLIGIICDPYEFVFDSEIKMHKHLCNFLLDFGKNKLFPEITEELFATFDLDVEVKNSIQNILKLANCKSNNKQAMFDLVQYLYDLSNLLNLNFTFHAF